VYLGRASGGGLRRLTSSAPGSDLPGAFSPDGTRIAFFRERPGVQGIGSAWIVNVDGTGLAELTPPDFTVGFGTMSWSTDGRLIVFAAARDQADGALWEVAPDGSGLRRIFLDPRGDYAITPTWSPDGTMIMFALDPTADEDAHVPNELHVVRADGSGAALIRGDDTFKRVASWIR
jgi:Tol biopolymer transport system component